MKTNRFFAFGLAALLLAPALVTGCRSTSTRSSPKIVTKLRDSSIPISEHARLYLGDVGSIIKFRVNKDGSTVLYDDGTIAKTYDVVLVPPGEHSFYCFWSSMYYSDYPGIKMTWDFEAGESYVISRPFRFDRSYIDIAILEEPYDDPTFPPEDWRARIAVAEGRIRQIE